APAFRWFQRDLVVALVAGQKGSLIFGVARLTTPLAFRWGLASQGLGVGMFGTRRQRRIPRGLVQTRFQLLDLRQQHPNDGLGFRRLSGNQFLADLQLHALQFAKIFSPWPDCLRNSRLPGCERLRGEPGIKAQATPAAGPFNAVQTRIVTSAVAASA